MVGSLQVSSFKSKNVSSPKTFQVQNVRKDSDYLLDQMTMLGGARERGEGAVARIMEECGHSSLNFMVGMKEEAHFPGGRRECAGQTEQMSCMPLPSTPPGSLQNMPPPRSMEQHLHLNRQPGDCSRIHI